MKINYACGSKIINKNINNLKLELNAVDEQEMLHEIDRLRGNKLKVHDISTEKTLDILDKCGKLWLDEEYAEKHLKVLSQITNQSIELMKIELKDSAQMLLRENMLTAMREELGDSSIFDEWIRTSYGYSHRQPRGIIFHNISGNAFVVILMSISMGLLSKNCNFVKVSGDEPYFANAFYNSLCEIDPSISERLSVVYFDSSEEKMYETVVKYSDAVIHWGGERSSKIMGSLCAKYQKSIIMHGEKISFEVVDDEENIPYTAEAIARDIIYWEQKACLSPRIVFVNKNIDARKVAKQIADNLREVTASVPKAYLTPWNSMKTIQDRQYCTIKYGVEAKGTEVYSSYNADYTVILRNGMPDKEDINSCFYRFIFVCPFESKNDIYEYAEENLKEYLQTMGYEGHDEEFIEKMTLLGVSTVTRPGEMPLHFPGTSHDGISNLTQLSLLVSRQNKVS